MQKMNEMLSYLQYCYLEEISALHLNDTQGINVQTHEDRHANAHLTAYIAAQSHDQSHDNITSTADKHSYRRKVTKMQRHSGQTSPLISLPCILTC